jgi:prevent-host-death family protein
MDLAEDVSYLPTWKSQDAKARFPELVREAKYQDQLITNRKEPVAVLVSKKRYDDLTKKPNSLLDFFRSAPLSGIDIEFERSKDFPREIEL